MPERTWCLAFLSFGEVSLAERLAELRLTAMPGQEVRMIDLAAGEYLHGVYQTLHDAANGAELSQRIRAACQARHGVAGPAFVEALCGDIEVWRSKAIRLAEDLYDRLKRRFAQVTDPAEHRIMIRWARIASAISSLIKTLRSDFLSAVAWFAGDLGAETGRELSRVFTRS